MTIDSRLSVIGVAKYKDASCCLLMTETLAITGNEVQIPMDFMKGCNHVSNLAFLIYQGTKYGVFQCKTSKGKSQHTVIRIYDDDKFLELPIEDTSEFLDWDNKDHMYGLFGTDDPRIIELHNEIYLQFSRTNPQQTYPLRGISYMRFDDIVNGIQRDHFIQPDKRTGVSVYEKHWVLFSDNEDVYAIRSLNPYLIGKVKDSENAIQKTLFEVKDTYDCVPKQPIVFDSGAIRVNDGYNNYYVISFHLQNGPNVFSQYHPQFAIIEAQAPFNLVKIVDSLIQTNMTYSRFLTINALSVKDSEFLDATISDTILAKGILDGNKSFVGEIKVSELMALEGKHCERLNLGPQAFTGQKGAHVSLSLFVVLSALTIFFTLLKFFTRSSTRKVPLLHKFE